VEFGPLPPPPVKPSPSSTFARDSFSPPPNLFFLLSLHPFFPPGFPPPSFFVFFVTRLLGPHSGSIGSWRQPPRWISPPPLDQKCILFSQPSNVFHDRATVPTFFFPQTFFFCNFFSVFPREGPSRFFFFSQIPTQCFFKTDVLFFLSLERPDNYFILVGTFHGSKIGPHPPPLTPTLSRTFL